MSRWSVIFLLTSSSLAAVAPSLTVGYGQTISVPVPGALAAVSLNDLYAGAKVEHETLIVFGKNPGFANVVVVISEGTETFTVHVLQPPASFPPGFVLPLSAAAVDENGSYESHFTSNPSQWENIVSFMRREGDRSVSFHLATALEFKPFANNSVLAFSSVFYRILTSRRDITLLDELTRNSALTVDGLIVRGFHLREDRFLFHAGYTSSSVFQNLILPAQKEGVAGVGYRFSAGSHSDFIPNLYFFAGNRELESAAPKGTVVSLVYDYEPGKNLGLLAEAGFSRGIGAALRFHSFSAHNHMTADLRYEPKHFAGLSLNNLHGFYSNLDWSRDINSKLASTFDFTGNHYNLPSLNLVNIVANLNLRFQLSRHWVLISGASYGRSASRLPPGPAISSGGLPLGINFDSDHFQGGFLYQISKNSGAISRSDELRATLGTHLGGFHWSAYAERQTQALAIAFSAAGTNPSLQEALDKLAISSTTPEEIAQTLSQTAGLLNQRLIQAININVAAVRVQAGTDLSWYTHSHSHQRFDFRLLYDKDEAPQGANRETIGTFSYWLKFKNVNEFFSSISLLRGGSQIGPIEPLVEIGVRHQLSGAPNFLIARRRGAISGVVFADNGASGAYRQGMGGLPGVEVVLDNIRRIRTDRTGRYTFFNVSYDSHTVEAVYQSASPFFFTTASKVQTDINTEVNFGVGASVARLFGSVRNDAGVGVEGVELIVSRGPDRIRSHTDADGKFHVEVSSSGEYEVQLDIDSLPAGYTLLAQPIELITIDPSIPAQIAFTLAAVRNISGRVLIYDRTLQQQVFVPGIAVLLSGNSRQCVTDKNGFYLFRNLPSGAYGVTVIYKGRQIKKEATLPDGPAFPKNIDIILPSE